MLKMQHLRRIASDGRVREQATRLTVLKRTLSTTPAPAPSPRSAFELDDAPLFSLRTRVIFFSTVGGLTIGSILSYWLNSDRENAYKFQDAFPSVVRYLGPYLGLPLTTTGELDRSVLGARDVRDLVGERVALEVHTKNGTITTLNAESLQSLAEALKKDTNGIIEEVIVIKTKAAT